MKNMFCGVLLLAALIVPGVADASTYRWQVDASGDWNNPANWEVVEGPAGVGYPNLPGDAAVFDEPITATRTIAIPDLVTVSIGRLVLSNDNANFSYIIERLGGGILVFDNAGEDAAIENTGLGGSLQTPVLLNADLVITGSVAFHGGIGETGGTRNVTLATGSVTMGPPANTYSGITTIADGDLIVHQADPVSVRVPGPLVLGDGDLANGDAKASLVPGSIAASSDVLVHRDGIADFNRIGVGPLTFEIDDLTVEGGTVNVAGTLGALQFATLTMEGGTLAGNRFVLLGTLTATSSADASAVIAGPLTLTAAAHDFVVSDGPLATDLRIDAPISGLAFGLNKLGAGTAVFNGGNDYSGATTVTAGTLLLNGGSIQPSPVTVAGGTLGGGSIIGSVTATSGTVSPGAPGATAVLTTRNVTLSAASRFVVDINGSVAGTSYDQLLVAGLVSLGGAQLVVNTPLPLAPDAEVTILSNDLNDSTSGTFDGLPEGLVVTSNTGMTFQITYVGGSGNDVVLRNITPVNYFLSEGATGSFFDEDVLIANPNLVEAPIMMTFYLPGTGTFTQALVVPPQSRITVKVDEIPELEATSPSVQVSSTNRLPLAVERTMFWDSTHYGGHTANAVPQPERKWYFAEGAQNGFFDTYLLLGNANSVPIDVLITYLRENDTPVTQTVTLTPASRLTVYAGDNPALAGNSFGMTAEADRPFIAERAMYFATTPTRLWSGGHANIGSAAPATSWFHAEGASGGFFSTFILMSNPQDADANVTLRFLLQDGEPVEITRNIPAMQRLTINPADLGEPTLQNAAFATVVTSDVPIVSERVMYWPEGTTTFGEGHASSGVVRTATNWALAEGRVGGPEGYTTYILLANPTSDPAAVTVTFLRENGAPVTKTYDVPASSRFNVDVGGMVPELQHESFGGRIDVNNGVAIAVERSMYWNANGIFWAGGSNALAEVVPQ